MLREIAKVLGLIVGLAASAAMTFLSQIMLARHLGPTAYGFLAACFALMTMTGPYVMLGMGGFWLRVFGKEGWMAQRWLSGSLKAAGITAPLAVLGFSMLGLYGFGDYESGGLILWLIPVLLMQALAYLSQVRWQLEHRYRFVSLSNLLLPGLRIGVAVLALSAGLSLQGVLLSFAIFGSVVAVFLAIGMYRFIKGKLELSGHGPKPHAMTVSEQPGHMSILRGAWPFALQNSFEIVLLQISVFVLASIGSADEAAMFSVALTFVNATFMIPSAVFAGYLLPKLHRWAEHDQKKLLMTFRSMSGAMLVLGASAGVVMFMASPIILPLVFGNAYKSAIPVLEWLSLVIPLRFLATAVGNPLITGEHIYRRLGLIAISTAVSLAASFALIPSYGAKGGAWAVILGHFCLLGLYAYGTVRHVLGREALKHWFVIPKVS